MPHSKFWYTTLLVILIVSCKTSDPENPYEGITTVVENDNPDLAALEEGSFPWLQEKVFRPTCANSGCHDGTFEPEFRSISSSYNSLVNHPVIANDPGQTFEYRVVPNNADASWLHERLTVFVENTSGMMPLSTSGSDWEENGDMYIQKITEWINNGAKDMYGNNAPPADADYPPMIYGFVAFPHNNITTPYPREVNKNGIGPVLVDNDLVDVWVLAYDQETLFSGLSGEARLSDDPTDFTGAVSFPFVYNSSPLTALDFGNNTNYFYHKATLDLSGEAPGSTLYMRNYIEDGVQPNPAEIPNDASQYFWHLIFSMKIQ
ncbi:MAG: hypothetical protein JNM00_13020 [Flavobacteriales bacterium]|nr:hypothetical protein [Flavobacteriales bacterium]